MYCQDWQDRVWPAQINDGYRSHCPAHAAYRAALLTRIGVQGFQPILGKRCHQGPRSSYSFVSQLLYLRLSDGERQMLSWMITQYQGAKL